MISMSLDIHEKLIKSIKAASISELIADLVLICRLWGQEPEMINEGNCESFALDVVELWPAATIEWGNSDGSMEFGGGDHCFVKYKSRYYDSESPRGVDNWLELPFFVRENSRS